ncbi:MAG: glycosyltransferase [Acidimicrobiales bacterium]
MGDEALVVSTAGVVSLLNYAYTLLLLWLLPTREFAEVGSVSALLLICGTVAGAALPWVLAQEVLHSKQDRPRRRRAVTFCLFATVLQGVGAGLATCLIVARYTNSNGVLAAAFCSVLLIFMAATVTGYFQGNETFRMIALLRVAEVVVKVAAGVGLIALGAGASGAVAGFALGAGIVAGVGLIYIVPDLQLSWSALAGRHLWASTQGLMAIQSGVAILASMDVVIGSLIIGAQPAMATYLAANVLGRVPVFIGAALSIVIFPRMIARRTHPSVVIRDSFALYLKVCIPLTLCMVTLPRPFIDVIFPARYGDVAAILPWSALAGAVMGLVNLTTTYFQAAGIYRRTTYLLTIGVVTCGLLDVVGLMIHGILGLAIGVAVGGTLVAGTLIRDISRVWPGTLGRLAGPAAVITVACLPLFLLRGDVLLWALWASVCGVIFCFRGLLTVSSGGEGTKPTKPRVLHLGYEDPSRRGAGGGSVRTHEISRRLSDSFDITVVCARFRHSRPREENGVRYVHVGIAGLPGGDFTERLTYFALIPWALLRYRSDLVIEDFGAPFSTVAVPWMTTRPVLGVVQWLFAREKSRQYHVPFSWVERMGVRSHYQMIAVSEDLGMALSDRNRRAGVTVIANGLEDGAFAGRDVRRSDIVYLGRLEIAQKGLDLLLEAFARIADDIEQTLVIAGDGPDEQALKELALSLGIGDRVRFIGRVAADDRFELLASADVVAMPSRYETYGMVAAESLAVRTPVVAFDIPCLRALIDDTVGIRVTAFDASQFADALRSLSLNKTRRHDLGSAGPDRVKGLRWDDLAAEQGRIYENQINGARCASFENGVEH